MSENNNSEKMESDNQDEPTQEVDEKVELRASVSTEKFWRDLIVEYWYITLIASLLVVGAIIGFILTFGWYIKTATFGNGGQWTFNDFSMRTGILWMIFLFLWQLLIVGLPTIVAFAILFIITWLKLIPAERRKTIKARIKSDEEEEKKKKDTHAGRDGGAFGFIIFIGFCIKIAVDGNWNTTFANLDIAYLVDVWLTSFVWVVLIIGIPLCILGLIWFVRKFA